MVVDSSPCGSDNGNGSYRPHADCGFIVDGAEKCTVSTIVRTTNIGEFYKRAHSSPCAKCIPTEGLHCFGRCL